LNLLEKMATLEELRKEARKLENKLNEKLVSYSKYGMNFFAMREEDRNPTSLRPEDTSNSLSIDIEETLSQLKDINERMARCEESAALPHILQHHRSKLYEFESEFKKTKAKIAEARHHADLVYNMRDVISNAKNVGVNSRMDSLLRERGVIHEADHIADQLIAQAQETREQLSTQRSILSNMLSSISGMQGTLPSINSIVSSIKKKKYKDMLVLGTVIGLCVCFLIFYWLRS